jgi:hypothetical protein
MTGRYLYDKYGKLSGHDLIKNPDKLNDVKVAADVMIEFFKNQMKSSSNKLSSYNSSGINDFKNVQDSTGAFYHANAGWGKSTNYIQSDPTGGRKKAMSRVSDLLTFVNSNVSGVKKKLIPTAVLTALLIVSVYALYRTLKTK